MQQYFSKSKKDNVLYLYEYDLNHIKNVMRMKENDEIIVVYDKTSYICSLNRDLTSCNIKSVFSNINTGWLNKSPTIIAAFLSIVRFAYIWALFSFGRVV
mgnify:CR=1 FL=1